MPKTITTYAKQNRKKKTRAEKALHTKLLKWKIRFRSQRPFDFYIVDFLIPDRRLVIEVDGEYHRFNQAYDIRRTEYLREKGLKIIRVTNQDVLSGVIDDWLPKYIEGHPVVDIKNWREAYGRAAY